MFIVIEIQTNADGTVGTIVNSYASQPQAESKYHTILAAAALSAVPVHAAVILTNDGRMVSFQSYDHRPPDPEAE